MKISIPLMVLRPPFLILPTQVTFFMSAFLRTLFRRKLIVLAPRGNRSDFAE